jgi:hypothetical protein
MRSYLLGSDDGSTANPNIEARNPKQIPMAENPNERNRWTSGGRFSLWIIDALGTCFGF